MQLTSSLTRRRQITVLEAPREWPYMVLWVAHGMLRTQHYSGHFAAVMRVEGLRERGINAQLYCREHLEPWEPRRGIDGPDPGANGGNGRGPRTLEDPHAAAAHAPSG